MRTKWEMIMREWRGRGWTIRTRFRIVTVILLAAVFLAACDEAGAKDAVVEFSDPFAVHSVSEDGIEVLWSGFTGGHQPGDPSRFQVQLNNNSAGTWRGRYCLILMDQLGVAAPLEQGDFMLEPEDAQSTDLEVMFPEGLEEDSYALALVVHRPSGSLTQFVHIDMDDEQTTSAMLSAEASQAALAACPPAEE